MTSNQNAPLDNRQSRDISASSPIDRRTNSSTLSTGTNRFSVGSNKTGESSTAASQRSSFITGGMVDGFVDGADEQLASDNHKAVRESRASHRSQKSRGSGGFLLNNSVFEAPAQPPANSTVTPSESTHRHSTQEPKGKSSLRSPEKRHGKRRSNVGSGIGGSPLAANVINAGTGNGTATDQTKAGIEGQNYTAGSRQASSGLDVDSAQIVNLALNLSESRRNASRRIISTPLPPAPGIRESFVGGSLRQHLQQQRRVSRNVSPKPDRGQRAMTASPRIAGQGTGSPLQSAFDSHSDGQYQYHFSASTLARAEKAKNAIELMAQYRRLLQYVPPLKPVPSNSRAITPESPGTSMHIPSRSVSSTNPLVQPLGRQYNPLQYIRNRKVRARNSRAIDGEAQGFGDLEKVSSWVDAVTQQASLDEFQAADATLPPFSKAAEDAASPHASPNSHIGKGHNTPAKIKRPRVDWMVSPADLIADVFWLEQDDNRRMVEDRNGRPIFPQSTDLKRPMSRRCDGFEPKKSPLPAKAEDLGIDLRIDTKLPEFKSVKPASEHFSDSTTSRARRKLHDVRESTRFHHGHNGSARDSRLRLRSHSRSDSSSSESDIHRAPRRRSGTAESTDRTKDILEKQMMEMLAREEKESGRDNQNLHSKSRQGSEENQKPSPKDELEKVSNGKASHSRSESLVKDKHESLRGGSSGRASLEVPGTHPRSSLEDLNTTAPNSPVSKATRIKNAFIPSIGMDLSSRKTRQSSPVRKPLARMRSKVRPFYDRDHPSHEQADDDEMLFGVSSSSKDHARESPETPDPRRRSMSPVKKISSRATDDGNSLKKTASIRKGKGEDSGIRGLFKARNPVSRVSDLLFKKEPSAMGTSSGFSTDESDVEDARLKGDSKGSRDSSAGLPLDDYEAASPQKERSSYLRNVPVLPTFTSPFERRGRSTRAKVNEMSPEPESSTSDKRSRIGRKVDAPRIDVQNASPTSSPDSHPNRRYDRDSSVSDIDSRRGSMSNGVQMADARLNSILGLPGKRRNALPITGLSNLETSYDTRPSLEGKRQWSISDRDMSSQRGPMTKREIARVRALLLSSGIKAKEISRRAAEPKDLKKPDESAYNNLANLAKHPPPPVPKSQEHRLAARIISDNIQLSSQLWRESADTFVNETVATLIENIANLQHRLVDNLTPMTRTAADEADEVSKDLVTSQTLKVKRITDTIDKMTRRRRRRFRWLRRGGWVLVEWALVGIMWYVWFMVVIARVVMGVGRGVVGGLRWLFWLS
ncbi:uncharacterized protein LY89DRAFT_679149 [Mollisia scopiformis]|uniref:Uncharacterized protein n=1 Tax=Mollisia scopiformis TaxID=149040 RepID=A0A194XUZ8_MOLSC|nr:uncharacterized protein LY89DRAFT_679149 [Mollisia scopiformis]KUJ23859.1 hypothetical protein LY89DRAFT_679149 [Mollisia scopiformis]